MESLTKRVVKDIKKNTYLYILALPVIAYYIVFHYWPMYGVVIAFKDFSPFRGISGSNWVGFKHFVEFFNNYQAWRVIRNTVLIGVYEIIFAFPAPIVLALLINEIKGKRYKKLVQTVSYMPHFISTIVICGLILDFVATDGVINDITSLFGLQRTSFLMEPKLFRPVYIISGIWQTTGWGSIVYLAAISGIDPTLYEASIIDGAGRFKQLLHITLPGIASTIVVLFILRVGRIMTVGWEKIILLYNPLIYETADVISSYVYRRGIQEFDYSFSTAVGLFNSAINFVFLITANKLSRKYTESSLW